MKKRIFSILFALVLVFTLGLVTAVPAGAQTPGDIEISKRGDGTAEWSADKVYRGSYSVKLDSGPVTGDMGVIDVWIDPILLSSLTTDPTYWLYEPIVVGLNHPYYNLWIDFDGIGPLGEGVYDTDGPGGTEGDWTAMEGYFTQSVLGEQPLATTWTEMKEVTGYYGYGHGSHDPAPLSDWIIELSIYPDAVVYKVQIILGGWGLDLGPVYLDDVTIGNVTYELEPETIADVTMSPEAVAADLSKEITFTVENTVGPAIEQFELLVPQNGSGPQYIVSEVVTPGGWIMSYSTDIASGRVSGLTWTKSDGGIAYGASQDFEFTATTPLDTGTYAWEYTITNEASSQEGSVDQGVDGDAPVIAGVAVVPDPNVAGFISEDSVAISATITDTNLDTDNVILFHSTDLGVTWLPVVMSGEGDVYSATLPGLDEGELWYYLYAKDTVDPNVATNPLGAPEVYHSFTVDTIAPDAPDALLLTVNQNPPGTADSVEGATGAVEGDALVEVWAEAGLTTLIGSITAADDGSFAAIDIGDNSYGQVWVTARDAAGNCSEATSVLNDTDEPEITSVTWAVDGDPDPIALEDVIDVTIVGDAGCTGTFIIGTIATGVAMTEVNGTYTGSYTVQSGDDGKWTVTGYLTDAAGNTSEATATLDVTIVTDVTAPVIGEPTVEYPVGVYSARVGDPVIISVEVTDPGEPTTGVKTVLLDASAIGLDTRVPLEQVADTNTWTTGELTVDRVELGTKTLTIYAFDGAGIPAVPVEVEVEVTLLLTGYNIALSQGWNLISLPLIPDDDAIGVVLAGIDDINNITSVYYWNNDGTSTGWQIYLPVSGGELTTMEDGKAYFVFMSGEAILTITGITMPEPPTTPPFYDVYADWNLVGFKSLTDMPNETYLTNLFGSYTILWGYQPVVGYHLVQPGNSNMEVGCGYWLWATESGTIVPPAQ